MSKGESGSWSDDSHFGKVQSNDSQSNYYVGSKETGDHCHMWKDKTSGESGVVHRGSCKVCGDSSGSGK